MYKAMNNSFVIVWGFALTLGIFAFADNQEWNFFSNRNNGKNNDYLLHIEHNDLRN